MRTIAYVFCLLYPAANLLASDAVILVEDAELHNPAEQVWLTEELELRPSADGGELLRSIPGVSGTRMGGRGIDPIIRGQSQNRLNILRTIRRSARIAGGSARKPARLASPDYSTAKSWRSNRGTGGRFTPGAMPNIV